MLLLKLSDSTNITSEIIQSVGGVAGIATLIWQIVENKRRYLEISIQVSHDERGLVVTTGVKNTKMSRKRIDCALLIISPEDEDIEVVGNTILYNIGAPNEFQDVNDFRNLGIVNPMYIYHTHAVIPLNYYFDQQENRRIADETITYSASIDAGAFNPGPYSVRFYLYQEGRYPRSTQGLFIIL